MFPSLPVCAEDRSSQERLKRSLPTVPQAEAVEMCRKYSRMFSGSTVLITDLPSKFALKVVPFPAKRFRVVCRYVWFLMYVATAFPQDTRR